MTPQGLGNHNQFLKATSLAGGVRWVRRASKIACMQDCFWRIGIRVSLCSHTSLTYGWCIYLYGSARPDERNKMVSKLHPVNQYSYFEKVKNRSFWMYWPLVLTFSGICRSWNLRTSVLRSSSMLFSAFDVGNFSAWRGTFELGISYIGLNFNPRPGGGLSLLRHGGGGGQNDHTS